LPDDLKDICTPANEAARRIEANAAAERAILSALLVDAKLTGQVFAIATPEHFQATYSRWIARAIFDLWKSSKAVNAVAVSTYLNNNGKTAETGGVKALAELIDTTPAYSDTDIISFAEQIREHSILKALAGEADHLSAICQSSPLSDVAVEFQKVSSRAQSLANVRGDLTSIPDIVERIGDAGDRYPLGFEPLDRLSRGGVFRNFRIGIGGGPGTGKTTLCSQLALKLAYSGWCVRWVAVDEDPEEILCRWLQQDGVPQDEAELLTSEDATFAAEALGGLDIKFIESPLIDTNMNWTDGNDFRVVFIDSLQQVAVSGCESLEPRARVDFVLKFIKHEFSRKRILTIWTSELARGAYRNQASQDSTDPIAASKESGGIEYFASILAVMRSVKDSPDLVEVAVPKVRRGGRRGDFCLRLDRAACTFSEVSTDGNAAALAHDRALDKLATEIIDLLRRRPRGLNVTAIRGEVDASPNRIQAALERLRMAGAAAPTDGTKAREKVWQAINHGGPNAEN
jgi:archaellum biogenesis ATPase FlaH